MKERTL